MIVIYMIINYVNSKVYIGSTNNIIKRFSRHKYLLNNSIHFNEHLQNAWNKYGSDSFEFKTLMVCPDSEREYCEQMFIDLYNSQDNSYGYNIKDAAGHFFPEETLKKMSKNNAKYWEGKKRPEHSERMSGKNSPNWKNYARIVKCGFRNNKQVYAISFNGKSKIKQSWYINKLIKWFNENYPDEELVVDDKA